MNYTKVEITNSHSLLSPAAPAAAIFETEKEQEWMRNILELSITKYGTRRSIFLCRYLTGEKNRRNKNK